MAVAKTVEIISVCNAQLQFPFDFEVTLQISNRCHNSVAWELQL